MLERGLDADSVAAAEAMAGALAGTDRILTVGSGVDRIAVRELALKIEEGAQLPAAMRDLETMLHGHLAGTDERTGLVLVLADPTDPGRPNRARPGPAPSLPGDRHRGRAPS